MSKTNTQSTYVQDRVHRSKPESQAPTICTSVVFTTTNIVLSEDVGRADFVRRLSLRSLRLHTHNSLEGARTSLPTRSSLA